MNPIEKLTELLTNKSFSHNSKDYCFQSCKKVNENIMILTNKETLQIPASSFDNFYQNVRGNCVLVSEVFQKPSFIPEKQNIVKFIPEMPKIYQKLNDSFDKLIDAIDSAGEGDLKHLEVKAKMLTSMAQTAIGMENSRIALVKIIHGK